MERLQRLRKLFLGASSGTFTAGAYWRDQEDLRLYDETLGKRIVWKWLSVFEEFARLGLPTPSGRILDFGCGAGTVGEALQQSFADFSPAEFYVWDHSPEALKYCEKKFSALRAKAWTPDPLATWDWIFVSHVLNELNAHQKGILMSLLRRAKYGVIVEPGTKLDFQNLATLRHSLLNEYSILAPCTHSGKCPLQDHPQDWCHHFAETPAEIFGDPEWAKYQQELGIDLSSLPYSYLLFAKKMEAAAQDDLAVFDRQIGTPRMYKGFAKILACHKTEGVRELEFQKREDGEIFKALKKGEFPRLVEWERDPKNHARVVGVRKLK